jgi:hypothetical protein
MQSSAPSWYIGYQILVIGTGLILFSYGALMIYRRRHTPNDGRWLHGVVHGMLAFNGCVYIVWGVDPWCLNQIYSYKVPPMLRNLLNITALSGLLLWTSVLLEGIKDSEGKFYNSKTLRTFLWKVPTVMIILLSFACQIVANQMNARWPLGINVLFTLLICFIASVVAFRTLFRVSSIFQKSHATANAGAQHHRSVTGGRHLVILKLKGTIALLIFQIIIAIYNSVEFLRSKQTLEQYEVPQDTSRPFIPTNYITRVLTLPIIFYLFWIPPTSHQQPPKQASTNSPSAVTQKV